MLFQIKKTFMVRMSEYQQIHGKDEYQQIQVKDLNAQDKTNNFKLKYMQIDKQTVIVDKDFV